MSAKVDWVPINEDSLQILKNVCREYRFATTKDRVFVPLHGDVIPGKGADKQEHAKLVNKSEE